MVLVYGMADSCLYNKQNDTWMLGDFNYGIYLLVFTFDISLVRYRCEHSKRNSLSQRTHVLFSV